MPMKASEQRLYQSQSPLTILSLGHMRMAIVTGWAVLIPNFLAGMDAAVTMLLRSEGSPATTEGTSLMSSYPWAMSFTAVQLRNAEFTSMWKMTLFLRSDIADCSGQIQKYEKCSIFGLTDFSRIWS